MVRGSVTTAREKQFAPTSINDAKLLNLGDACPPRSVQLGAPKPREVGGPISTETFTSRPAHTHRKQTVELSRAALPSEVEDKSTDDTRSTMGVTYASRSGPEADCCDAQGLFRHNMLWLTHHKTWSLFVLATHSSESMILRCKFTDDAADESVSRSIWFRTVKLSSLSFGVRWFVSRAKLDQPQRAKLVRGCPSSFRPRPLAM